MTAGPQRLVVGLAGLLALSMGAGLALEHAGMRDAFVALACGQALVYAAAIAIVLKHGIGRRALVACLVAAGVARAIVVPAPPTLSDDVYRYVWDGRVQAAGINPYRYIPADPALAGLRDQAIYPNINRKDYARTIYPPGAQAIYLAVTRFGASVTVMKLAMIGFEIAALVLLLSMLRRAGLPPARVLLYALHPLPVWEFAGSGHVDAAMIALACAALWLHQRGGRWSTGIALAASCIVKPFPLALAPALWRRWDWRMPLGFALAVALAYAPYLGVGAHVLGFLPTYFQEEGMDDGTGLYPLWLLRALSPVAIPTAAYLALAALVLAGLALVAVSRSRGPETAWRDGLLLACALMLATSPHFAWYFPWLLALACLAPWLPALYLVSVAVVLYLPIPFALAGSVVFGGFAVIALLDRLRPERLLLQEKPDAVGHPS